MTKNSFTFFDFQTAAAASGTQQNKHDSQAIFL